MQRPGTPSVCIYFVDDHGWTVMVDHDPDRALLPASYRLFERTGIFVSPFAVRCAASRLKSLKEAKIVALVHAWPRGRIVVDV